MSLSKAPESANTDFKAVTARGLKVSICTLIAEVGTIESEYKGEKKKLNKVYFEFTLANGEKIGKLFTYSFHDQSGLTKALTAWVSSKDFNKDLTVYLNSLVILNLVENEYKEKTYVNIDSFICFEGSEMKQPTFEDVKAYIFDYDSPETHDNLKHVPQHIFNKMETTKEYEAFRQNKLQVTEQYL